MYILGYLEKGKDMSFLTFKLLIIIYAIKYENVTSGTHHLKRIYDCG